MPATSQHLPATRAPERAGRGTSADAGSGRGSRRQVLPAWLPRILGDLLIIGAWHGASGRLVPAFVLPSPLTIAQEVAGIAGSGQLWRHFGATVRTIAIGYAVAFAVGFGVGLMMARPRADAVLRIWVVAFLNTPGLVFALVATMIFGFHPVGPISAVVLSSFPFVTVNIAEGVRAIPKDLVDMGRAFDVAPARRVRQIIIPFLAPYTFAALRYGFSIAWKIAIFAELFGSASGIGFMIRNEFGLFSMSGMLAWILLFCAFALLLEALLQLGMRRCFRWRPDAAVL